MEEIVFMKLDYNRDGQYSLISKQTLEGMLMLKQNENTLDELIQMYKDTMCSSFWTVTKMIGIPYDNN